MNDTLLARIEYIYSKCRYLLNSTFKFDLPVAGNIGVFAQSEQEYNQLKSYVSKLIIPSDNPDQKYFQLIDPLSIKDREVEAVFTHIYIRKHDLSDYGLNKGDVDFLMESKEYNSLKEKVLNNDYTDATMYDRPGWDTVQIMNEEVDAVAYIATQEMAEKVRIKFDNLTNL